MLNDKQQQAQAKRALAEAELRKANQPQIISVTEIDGRGGQDPSRYGDWEIKGRAIDF